ncbi:Nudix family hydrolase [soil metagenome]
MAGSAKVLHGCQRRFLPIVDPSNRQLPLHVVAGVLTDSAGRVLVNRRLRGKPLAGKWEFPGGKLERGEGRLAGLERELREELGIEVRSARPLVRFRHGDGACAVSLDIWRVDRYAGVAAGRQDQSLRWVEPAALRSIDLLEADAPIVMAISLPDRYLITAPTCEDPDAFLESLDRSLARGIELVQLRLAAVPGREADYRRLALACAGHCRRAGARLLLNGAPQAAAVLTREIGADGIHVPARHLQSLAHLGDTRPRLVGASCHNARELSAAERAGADFAVLGPVQRTASHPGARELGWAWFADLVEEVRIPVFALGGLQPADLPRAWTAGAQGIAAIRGLWAPVE